jgi:virginiamycin B lyase
VLRPARRLAIALGVAAAWAGAGASAAGAAVTTWPTCPAVPLTGDSALCSSGRSPQQIVAGPDGALWFTAASSEVGRMTTSGSLSLVPTPGTGTRLPESITVGPDGALWYADAFGPTIGRVTTAFAFTPLPDTGFRPEGVAAGADGALWVVESTDTVARVTTAGTVTRFPVPAKTTAPSSSIAPGPDGRLWFTGRTTLGAISTAGVAKSYALPDAAGGCPGALATRSGERVWFADYCRDRVGSASVTGTVDWYAFPAGGPEAIAFGPDGNLWIGLGRTGQIVRMTPSGTVLDMVALLYAPQFGGIAPGPDGAVWFTELTSPQVGRIDVPSSAGHAASARVAAAAARSTAAAAAPGPQAPPSVRLVGARLSGSALQISVSAGEAGRVDARAALVRISHPRLRPGGAGLRLRPTPLGRGSEAVAAAGSATLRLTPSAQARRALARARRGTRGATVEVAVRLRTATGRTTSRQRRIRVR